MKERMTAEQRQARIARGSRKREDAQKQRGKLGILVDGFYVFWNTAHTGYCFCRIEHGVETEVAECIPRTALDPYARVVFVREGPALVALDPNSLDAVNIYGQNAPALGVPSQPMGNRGSGDWTPTDGNILVGDGTQFSSTPFIDVFEDLIGYLATGESVLETVASGVLTVGFESAVIVAPETPTTDDIRTLAVSGNPRDLWLIASTGSTLTLKQFVSGADNIFMFTGADLAFIDIQAVKCWWDGTNLYVVAGGGSGTVDATDVTYTPTTPSDWSSVPTDVQEALDTLASEVVTGGVNKDLFTQTADVTVSNTTTPTTLLGAGEGSSTLAADYFTVGRTLVVDFSGFRSTALVAPNLTFEIFLGSTSICLTATFADVGSLSGQQFHGHVEITCRSPGASGSVSAQGWVELNSTATVSLRAEMATTSPVTLDTTISLAVLPKVTWGTASASNTITCSDARLQTVDPNVASASASGAQVLLYDLTLSGAGQFDTNTPDDFGNTGISQLYTDLVYVIEGSGVSQTGVEVFIDGDTNTSNYVGIRVIDFAPSGGSGGNVNEVGVVDNAGGWGAIEGKIYGYTKTAFAKRLLNQSISGTSPTFTHYWNYYNQVGAVTRLQFHLRSNTDFEAGSRLRIFGIG